MAQAGLRPSLFPITPTAAPSHGLVSVSPVLSILVRQGNEHDSRKQYSQNNREDNRAAITLGLGQSQAPPNVNNDTNQKQNEAKPNGDQIFDGKEKRRYEKQQTEKNFDNCFLLVTWVHAVWGDDVIGFSLTQGIGNTFGCKRPFTQAAR